MKRALTDRVRLGKEKVTMMSGAISKPGAGHAYISWCTMGLQDIDSQCKQVQNIQIVSVCFRDPDIRALHLRVFKLRVVCCNAFVGVRYKLQTERLVPLF